jgi:hypothetical protein
MIFRGDLASRSQPAVVEQLEPRIRTTLAMNASAQVAQQTPWSRIAVFLMMCLSVAHLQASCADLNKRLTGAHESLAQAQLDLGEAQGMLEHTRNKATAFENRCEVGCDTTSSSV